MFNDIKPHESNYKEEKEGVKRDLTRISTQAKAAKIAGLSLGDFLLLMAKYKISAADQSEAELLEELKQFQ